MTEAEPVRWLLLPPVYLEGSDLERKIKSSALKLSSSETPIELWKMSVSALEETGPFNQLMYKISYPPQYRFWFGVLQWSEFYPSVCGRPQMMRHLFKDDSKDLDRQIVVVQDGKSGEVLKVFRRDDWEGVQVPESEEEIREFLPGETPHPLRHQRKSNPFTFWDVQRELRKRGIVEPFENQPEGAEEEGVKINQREMRKRGKTI